MLKKILVSALIVGLSQSSIAFDPYDPFYKTDFNSKVTTGEAKFTFEVNIEKDTCKIHVGSNGTSASQNIYLGSIRNKGDTVGPRIPVYFNFECTSVASVHSIRFAGDTETGQTDCITTKDQGGRKRQKVKIYLYQNRSDNAPFKEKIFDVPLKVENNAWYPIFFAQVKIDQGTSASAGDFKGSGHFVVTFN